MPRIKPACVRRVSIGESSGSCSEEDISNAVLERVRPRAEEHMCPRCQEQFEHIHDFLHHKRVCDEKALQMGEERMHSDPEEMVVSGDEEMDEPNKQLDQVRRHRQDAENNNSLEESEAEVPEADVPPLGLPFPVASHVTLEALQNTKVAVAQFAATALANNTDNEAALHELAVLQSTLFTLQHQQVFQLQLIRQLQNQLSLNRRPEDQSQSPPPAELECSVSEPAARTPSPPPPPQREPTPLAPTPPASQKLPSTHGHQPPKNEPLSIPKLPTSSPPMMSHPPYSSISSSLASTIITNNDPPPSLNAPNTLEMLQKRAQEVLDNASQGLLANNLADELAFRKSGKTSPYDGKSGGRNEPFFKHRCRYCGKVFGSDSALQIHIRSHTGERPFKCNVCGSRFTTKGNLKVHFQRHTSKFPHVKMNPNPVPEHLDKFHPPLLSQLSPGPIPGMPPHPLQFNPGAPGPFPPGLPLFRPSHHDLMPPRPLGDKPLPPHPLFAMREEQDVPADLSKPSIPSPTQTGSDQIKSEPHDDELQRDSSLEENDRVTPKREPDENENAHDEQERFPSISPYDDCSMDSKYSNDDQIGRESPHTKADPDQPENLSSKNSPISGQITIGTGLRTFPAHPLFPRSPPSSISSGSITPFQAMTNSIVDLDLSRDPLYYNSLLPRPGSNDDSWESFIEINKSSETYKLQQLVDNIDSKVTDPNECIVCHRVLSCKSALQMHYRIHTGERPFRCKLCGRSFTTKGNLKTHMGVHRIKTSLETLHICPVCHKKFADPSALHQHIRNHTRESVSFPCKQKDLENSNQRFPENTYDTSRLRSFPPFPFPGDRRADCQALDDESGGDVECESSLKEFDDDSNMKDRRTSSPLSVSASVSESEVKTLTTTASLPSATGSESGRSARATPPSPALSTPPRHHHLSPQPSPPTAYGAMGPFGGGPFSPLGLAFPPAVRGNTTCHICYKTFACHSALEIHYRSHTKERPFKCNVCDRGFSTKSSGGGCRCRRDRPPRPPQATALDLWNAFVYPGNMKQHMLTHKTRDMPPSFDKSVSSGGTASEENTRDGSPERRSTPEKMDLKRSPPAHVPPPITHPSPVDMPPLPKRPSLPSVPQHPPPPPMSSKHLCGVCRKNFSSSSALQIHMRTHTGDKPFRCAVCQKAFTTKGNLKVHMGTHMWSGGASRRGRRMSLELPPRPLHEPHELLRRPDLFYPYLPAPFLNGMQQKLNEISVIQQNAGQNGIAAKFPGLLGFGAFGGARPGAASPLERPPSIDGEERQAAMRELAERGRELAERSRQMRDEADQYRPQPHGPLPSPATQPSPPAPHHPLPHPLASLPPPARTEGLTV